MELALEIKNNNEITVQDKAEIDKFIENAIEVHKGNSSQINKLVMASVTALTTSEARARELESQRIFKRAWNGLTGKNQKIIADIDRNLAKSQYASQKMIQRLAEQNLLAFDTITAVNNKLNTLMLEVDEEINRIYKTLIVFFKQTRSDLIQMENRIEKLERNVNLLHWNSTIEYKVYNGVEYCELLDIEKMVCVVNDFYNLSKGDWNTSDIMLLKSTLAEIGLSVKSKISSEEFYRHLIDKPELIDRLLENISLDGLIYLEEYQTPLLKGVEKLLKLQGEEKYILDTILSQLELANVNYNERDIQISIIHNYLMNTTYIRTDTQVNMFDFIVELINNINTINYEISYKLKNSSINFSSMEYGEIIKYAKAGNINAQYYLAERYYYGDNIEKNEDEALIWYVKAAEQGNIDAQLMVARIYYDEEDIKGLNKEAYELVIKAAEQGNVDAQHLIATMYYYGDGIEENHKEAFKWAIKAGARDNIDAQYMVGILFLNGDGIVEDKEMGIEWIKIAAKNGQEDAINFLSDLK